LNDPLLRENFIEKIFAYAAWRRYELEDGSAAGLVDFHTRYKLQLMAHSPDYYRRLGRLVANLKNTGLASTRREYLADFMKALSLAATIRKNVNVLQHIMGYFKRYLTHAEKLELQDLFDRYHRNQLPLIVPVTMLNHYILKYDQPYLLRQTYLHPHPDELCLRNHV